MDFTKLTLPSTVTVKRFKEKADYVKDGAPVIYARFEGKHDFAGPMQGLVYGTLELVLIDENTVWALPNDYDFNIEKWEGNYGRNIATIIGMGVSEALYTTPGKPFTVYFMGYQTIPNE